MDKETARMKALDAALAISGSCGEKATHVVKRARVIERYLLTGEVPEEQH